MSMKRWIAIIIAAALIFVSVGVTSLSFLFTRDFDGFVEKMMDSTSEYRESIVETGNGYERIAVLTVDGVIQDLGGASSVFQPSGYNHGLFMRQLNDVLEDESIKGIILKVNSPGGGVVESADIYDSIRLIQEERQIPVYVAMGGMAASGGYYISAPADKIFVNRETITGSIGVIMESLNYAKLAERYGIGFNTIKTGPYKDIMSGAREMTDEERAMLQDMINDSYQRFVEIIGEGRSMSEAEVKKIADGRIMNGRQAIEAGLADEIGKTGDAIAAMKEDYDLQDATVFEYSAKDSLLSIYGVKARNFFGGNVEAELIGKVLSDYNSPRMMYLYGER